MLGLRTGQKAFTLQSLPGPLLPEPARPFLASADGFSLHAGVSAGVDDRKKVERLCRYIARPSVATGRLSLTTQGQVRYTLKTPYRDGTTQIEAGTAKTFPGDAVMREACSLLK